MMKNTLLSFFLFLSIGAFGQNITKAEMDNSIKPINDKIKTLQSENSRLKNELDKINSKLSKASLKLDSLNQLARANSETIAQTSNELGTKIKETGKSNEEKISAVDKSLSKNSLLGIIAVLLALLVSGILYWLLSKRQTLDKTDLIEEMGKTKLSIEERLINEFNKQTDLMDTQFQIIEAQRTQTYSVNVEPDHSLALKLASEINLIERNVKLMDPNTKGLKQLTASIGKLRDNLSANGYEIIELLGKLFHQGMKVIVISSIADENLEKGRELISKVLIPQVNYNDKMIQTAQIETTKGQ